MKTDESKPKDQEEEKKEEESPEQDKENPTEDDKADKYINPELLNDDLEESNFIEKVALEIRPYFANNILPKSIYLQKTVLPLIYEALNQTEKKRPLDPIEFFAVYLLDHNKKDMQ